jgi:glycine hydroxymethyltransferase
MYDIIEHEKRRQFKGIVLIPSENYVSKPVLEALGSVMSNKYSEGLPGARYYGGNEFIDQSESLCQKRALEAFNLDPSKWGVNVQPLSGSPANMQAYTAVLQPHDRILSLDLPHGGHLSHGYQTPTKKISAVSIFYETLPYRLNEKTGLIDYDKMEELSDAFRPKLIVAGFSAYSRNLDFARFREVADKHSAYLLSDIAHISGLVASGVIPGPFEHSDIVTTTTHKSLRGPRGAMIFFRKGTRVIKKEKKNIEMPYELEDKVNQSVFPGFQGGPHNHTIAALAVALKLVKTNEFKEYGTQILKNCQVLSKGLTKLGYNIVSGGTDNHLILVDLKGLGIDGARVERVCELSGLALNKNTVPGDKSALVPGGIRLGTPAITSRGFLEKDCEKVVEFVHRAIQIALKVKGETKALKDFKDLLNSNVNGFGIGELKKDVEDFASKFPAIAFDQSTMRYK